MVCEPEIVVLALDGSVRRITTLARCWLSIFCGAQEGRRIPDVVACWVRAHEAGPLVISASDGRLEIQMMPCRRHGQEIVLILRAELLSFTPTIREGELTRSERDVLGWLLKGKTNHEIGQILGSKSRTVDKHVERIFRKIGVKNRREAIRRYVTGNGGGGAPGYSAGGPSA